MTDYGVGRKFPGAIPPHDATFLILNETGNFSAVCAYSGISKDDVAAFRPETIEYGLFEYHQNYPMAVLLFRFPPPLNDMEMPFNLKQETLETQAAFLKEKKNLLDFLLIERTTRIIRAISQKALDPAFVESLHAIAGQQLLFSISYSYDAELDALYSRFTTPESLWKYARKFR